MKNCPSWRNCWSGVNPEATTWRPCTSCLFSVLPSVISLLQFCLCCLPLWLFSLLTLCVNVCVHLYTYIHTANTRRLSELSATTPPSVGQQRELQLCLIFQSSMEQFRCFLCVFFMMLALYKNRWWTKCLRGCELSHSSTFLLLSEHSPSSAKDLCYCQKPRWLSSFLAAVYPLHHFILSDFGAEQQKCVRVLCQLSPSRHSKLSNKSSGVPPRGLPVSLLLWLVPVFYTAVTANSLSGEQVFPIRSRWCSVSLFADEASVFLLVFWVAVDQFLIVTLMFTHVWFCCPLFQPRVCQLFCGHVTKHKFRLKYAQLISNKKAFTGRDTEPTSGPLKTNCDLKLRCEWFRRISWQKWNIIDI